MKLYRPSLWRNLKIGAYSKTDESNTYSKTYNVECKFIVTLKMKKHINYT